MNDGIGITALIYVVAALVYILVLRRIDRAERRRMNRQPLTDTQCLARLALIRNSSEYDIFHAAAQDYHIPDHRPDRDFRTYVQKGDLPYYVRDYVRKRRSEIDPDYQPPHRTGGLPPSWSA